MSLSVFVDRPLGGVSWLRCRSDHVFAQKATNRKERFADLITNIHG